MKLTCLYLPLSLTIAARAAKKGFPDWRFVQNGTSGILALEAIIVSPTLAVFFDRGINDPMTIDGHPAWGALWNMETNRASPLNVVSDTFCATGGMLSNGTMVNLGGDAPTLPSAIDGRTSIRIFEPCGDPTGSSCKLFDNPTTLHLAESRWYPTAVRISDGSLLITGGSRQRMAFYNVDPVNSNEFFPSKDGGVPRNSSFLARAGPANMYPRTFLLPSGKVFMISGNQTILYNIETNIETPLPDIPNGVRVTNPFDGTATLLPLSPPYYTPEVLVCGGTNTSDLIPYNNLSAKDPASDQCSRITLSPEGIKKGWVIERMLEPRIMPEMLLLPNGDVMIINGAKTGYAAFNTVRDPVGNMSNADHPVFTPSIYKPDAPLGKRISNTGMPTTDIARLYHSVVTLTPKGNILLAGSNPNRGTINGTKYATEFRVEYLNPPSMTVARPRIHTAPKKIPFNHTFSVPVSIPKYLNLTSIKVSLMDLGFSSHAFHFSSRLVFLDALLHANRRLLTIRSPPNNHIYPPGPGWIYLTVDDIWSEGVQVLIGSGASPPVPDQGIGINVDSLL